MKLCSFYHWYKTVGAIKSIKLKLADYVARMEDSATAFKNFKGKPEASGHLEGLGIGESKM